MISVLKIARFFKDLPHQEAALIELDKLIKLQQLDIFLDKPDQPWLQTWRTSPTEKAPVFPNYTNHMNQAGLNLIRESEGCVLTAYLCPANVWTIGFGHTDPENAYQGNSISQERANQLLDKDLRYFIDEVRMAVRVPITDNQFSALVSFAFNVGIGALSESTLLRELNYENYDLAADQFLRWNRANDRVLPGLTTRRKKEQQLFNQVDMPF